MSQKQDKQIKPINKKKAKHEANQYLLDQFQVMAQKSKQRQDKTHFNYDKFVKAMTVYPLPLLTQKQALSIVGVGDKIAQMIMNKVTNQYGDYIRQAHELDDLNFDPDNVDQNGDLIEIQENQMNQQTSEENLDQIIDDDVYQYNKETQNYEQVTDENEILRIKNKILNKNVINGNQNKRSLQQVEEQRKQMGEQIQQKKPEKKIVNNKKQIQKKKTKKTISNILVEGESSQDESNNEDSSSNLSQNITKKRILKPKAYKPKEGSAAWCVVIALHIFKETKEEHYASKSNLTDILLNFKEFDVKIREFVCLKILIEKNVIKEWEIQGTLKYELTDYGIELAQSLYDAKLLKEKNKKLNQKIVLENNEDDDEGLQTDESQDKQNQTQNNNSNIILQNKILNEYEQGFIFTKKKSNKSLNSSLEENSILNNYYKNQNNTDEEDNQIEDQEYIKITKGDIKSTEIFLYIDEREKRDKNKDCKYFQRQLSQYVTEPEPEIKPLPIGDFLWVIDITFQNGQSDVYILDTIVERKTADDLAASIRDKRYKDQKRRLKQAPFKNIMYLVEGKLSQGAGQSYGNAPQITQKTIDSAVMSIRVKDKFKVKQTNSSEETIKWLSQMTLAIKNRFNSHLDRLEDDDNLEFLSRYEDFKNENMKHKKTSIQLQLGQMVYIINKSGENAARQIAIIYKTPINLYSQLLILKEECQDELNKNKRKKKNLQQLMVQKLRDLGKQKDSITKSQLMRKDAAEAVVQLFTNFDTSQQEFNSQQDSQKIQDYLQKHESTKSNAKFLNLKKKQISQVPQTRDFQNIKETIFGRQQLFQQNKPKKQNNLLKENQDILNTNSQDSIYSFNNYDYNYNQNYNDSIENNINDSINSIKSNENSQKEKTNIIQIQKQKTQQIQLQKPTVKQKQQQNFMVVDDSEEENENFDIKITKKNDKNIKKSKQIYISDEDDVEELEEDEIQFIQETKIRNKQQREIKKIKSPGVNYLNIQNKSNGVNNSNQKNQKNQVNNQIVIDDDSQNNNYKKIFNEIFDEEDDQDIKELLY